MEAAALEEVQGLWEAADWYQALCLTERVDRADAAPASRPLGPPTDRARAERRLRTWKAQSPFEQESLWAERLALDSVSEADLLFLLAEPADRLKARTAAVPPWLTALRDAYTDVRAGEAIAPLLEEVERDHPLSACLPALGPLLERGLASLEEGVDALHRSHGFVPVDAEALPRFFLANVAPTLLFQMTKPIILELHIARLQERLQGETAEARFADFMRQLSEERLIVSLLAKYPVLARQLVLTIDQWADYVFEFLTHLCADWDAIRTGFPTERGLGLLVDVDARNGDRHRRGRSVLLLHFDSGMRLLYKPKPLAVDVHFQQLLSWLNERGADPPFRPLKLIDRGDYGWSEYVAPLSCTSEDEVARFYERQGAYLALLYALDAADLHNENLIAAGEHPMLVDLEALFHPRLDSRVAALGNRAAGAMDESVWQVGLLPRRVWSDEESIGVDMSGLGGRAGQMNPHPVVGWGGAGSDEMRLRRHRVELPASDNRPRLRGTDVDALEYTDSIVSGFRRMYRLLCEQRHRVLGEQLPRFANDRIRVVVRSTNVYGLLLYESFHPDLLRDALDRDRFFDRLWGEAAHRAHLARVISAERRDLMRGDIPLFTTSPGGHAIYTSEGEPLLDLVEHPSLEVVRRRLESLGEDDLVKQIWIIEASLATLRMGRESAIVTGVRVPSAGGAVTQEHLVATATALGERLEQLALEHDDAASWLGVGPLDEATWGVFPTGADLYAGAAGISLFLAYLGAVTAAQSHTRMAHRALTAVRAQSRAWLRAEERDASAGLAATTLGAFEGIGSIIYLLTHLGALWRQSDLLDEAEELVARVPPLIASDTNLDVVYGSAGCILALLSLHCVRPSQPTLDAAIRCGDHLLGSAQAMSTGIAWPTLKGQPPLGGFSHGTAGIAFSLLQVAARSGEERFREAALEALAFDRSLFVAELGHWADLRVFPNSDRNRDDADGAGDSAPNIIVAWCHGAPGIGLGRLAALGQLDDSTVREEIDIALRATVEHGFAINHSLCHGALGNVELLLLAAELLGRQQDHDARERATAAIVASIEANGPVCGVPLGVETPGFMTGLAGIGYELLRLAQPQRVPSALVLAPPPRQTHVNPRR